MRSKQLAQSIAIVSLHACLVYSMAQAQSKAALAHVAPSSPFRDCADCPEMVVIPAGTFVMGAPADEPGFYPEQGPQRTVNVPSFAASKFDVTRRQWSAFVTATNHITSEGCQWSFLPKEKEAKASWRYLGFEQGDDSPVVCVTWSEVQDYVAWIGKRTGQHYRLLSEAEWEYAARSGTKTPYPWEAKPITNTQTMVVRMKLVMVWRWAGIDG